MYNVAQIAIPIASNREFDYSFDPDKTKLEKGMRVFIDFNGKKRIGIVVDLHKESKLKKLKPVIYVLDQKPSLDKKHIVFADKLSNIYPYARSEFIFMMLPPYLKKIRKITSARREITGGHQQNIGKKNTQEKAESSSKVFIKAEGLIQRYQYWKSLVAEKLEKGSVLICFPQLSYLQRAEKIISKDFPTQVRVIHSQEKEKELFSNWENSRNNVLILGTRVSIFYYPQDLELIIIEQENSPYYFQEEKPFYHLRDVALLLSNIQKVDLIFSGDFPSLAAYKLINDGEVILKDCSYETKQNIELVNISEYSKNRMLSPVFIELLRRGIKSQKKIIIFWNKRGFTRAVVCSNCGQIFKCKRCSAALRLILGSREGICPYCQSKEVLPKICNFCNNGYFKSVGYGIERLEANLRNIFPEVKIDNWQNQNIDSQIVLSTSQVLGYLDQLDRFDLGFCLDADYSVSRIDYNVAFNTFVYLKKISLFLKGKLYVFTSNQGYYLFSYLNKDWKDFYEAELKLRKSLNLPPFGLIIKVTLRSKSKNILLKRSEYIYNKLMDRFEEVYGPFEEQPFKLRDNFRYSIIAKTKRIRGSRAIIKEEIASFRTSSVKLAVSLH